MDITDNRMKMQIFRILFLAYYLCNLYEVQGSISERPSYLSTNFISCNDLSNPGFLAYSADVVLAASHEVVQTYRTFTPTGGRIISCILATDELNNGATARITAGGVNKPNVTIFFTSALGKGIYYTFEWRLASAGKRACGASIFCGCGDKYHNTWRRFFSKTYIMHFG